MNVVAPVAITNADLTRVLGRVMRRPAFMMAPRFAMRLVMGEVADALLFASNRVVPERLAAGGFEFSQPEVEGALRMLLRDG